MNHRTQHRIKKWGIFFGVATAELLIALSLLQSIHSIEVPPENKAPPEMTTLIQPCQITDPTCNTEPLIFTPKERAQNPDAVLYVAEPGEIWISAPTLGLPKTAPTKIGYYDDEAMEKAYADVTPPSPPRNVNVTAAGLFQLDMRWEPAMDAESGIKYYAYAVGTGTSATTEANIYWWQSVGVNTKASLNRVFTENKPIFVSVYAVNGAGSMSSKVRVGPILPTHQTVGQATNRITYTLQTSGYDAQGNVGAGWSTAQAQSIRQFLDRMFPVLYDLYGAPSTNYTVGIVRDLRQTRSAIFYPNTDAVHLGDSLTYQLLTHELVHAWRNDRILSSDNLWQYNAKYSGFEEGFAQAVSYDAMTEFARRHPNFLLDSKLYQSSHEWDYDYQNVPELRSTDFWSDMGGSKLFWARYEVAAAAMAKIKRQYPTFYRDFNKAYYERINQNPRLTLTRDIIVDIIASVAPKIEGKPAQQWVDAQYVFYCDNVPGYKTYIYPQHYPFRDYYIFNQIFVYRTYKDGTDWAHWNGSQWEYHYVTNGLSGTATLRDSSGKAVELDRIKISPDQNPPRLMKFGTTQYVMTTKPEHGDWPPIDNGVIATNIITNGLYFIETKFYSGTQVLTRTVPRVMGAALKDTHGIFGGIIGANGGSLSIKHQSITKEVTVSVTNQFFAVDVPWASLKISETDTIDTLPGVVTFRYVDANKNVYTDYRTIGYGSVSGNQAFLLDVKKMTKIGDNGSAGSNPGATPTPQPESVSPSLLKWQTFLPLVAD
jgi:hypothetical protein